MTRDYVTEYLRLSQPATPPADPDADLLFRDAEPNMDF